MPVVWSIVFTDARVMSCAISVLKLDKLFVEDGDGDGGCKMVTGWFDKIALASLNLILSPLLIATTNASL